MKFNGDSMSGVVEEVSVDWRGRPCKAQKHGGMTSAVFVLGLYLSSSPSRAYRYILVLELALTSCISLNVL